MDLFSSFRLGPLDLPNRAVMAPMTRSRAIGGVPNELMRTYYAQRASAGLIVSEGISPSPNGLGYARIPGLFSAEQVRGWRQVTDAVHAAGGRIVAQLMHTGRIGHAHNLPASGRVLAPSAVHAEGAMWTDQAGPQPHPVPEAMSEAEVHAAREEYVQAAKNAREAGFDGVELHGANGYLLEQFLNPGTNHRSDGYGGSPERRARFLVEVVEAIGGVIGSDRVGVRLSPFNTYNAMPLYDEVEAQYTTVARALRGNLYLHVIENAHAGYAGVAAAIRSAFAGPMILNGGFDLARAQVALKEGKAELISFGRPFIANPDLVRRLASGAALASPEPSQLYSAGAEGYIDYPALS